MLPEYITRQSKKRPKKVQPILGLQFNINRVVPSTISPDIPQNPNKKARHRYFQRLKDEGCCVDCGEPDPIVLSFHHRDATQKLFNIHKSVIDTSITWVAVLEELEKCDLICANCHRRRHYCGKR